MFVNEIVWSVIGIAGKNIRIAGLSIVITSITNYPRLSACPSSWEKYGKIRAKPHAKNFRGDIYSIGDGMTVIPEGTVIPFRTEP